MITRLYVDNYKALSNFELTLEPLNLILGENGSGKTTAFEVIDRLRRFVVAGDPLETLFKPAFLTRWDRRTTQHFELTLRREMNTFRYILKLEFFGRFQESRVIEEVLLADEKALFEAKLGSDGLFQTQLFRDNYSRGPQVLGDWGRSGIARLQERSDNQRLVEFRDALDKVYWVVVNPFGMVDYSDREDARPAPAMQNIVSWYRHCLQEDADFYNAFRQDLQSVIVGFEKLQLEKVGSVQWILKVVCQGQSFELMELSEGQRALFALYLLLHRAAGPGCTLIVDEPENFVTLREMQPWLTSIQDRVAENAQVLLISHHPEFVNHLANDCGLLFQREPGQPVRCLAWGEQTSELPAAELMARGWVDERK